MTQLRYALFSIAIATTALLPSIGNAQAKCDIDESIARAVDQIQESHQNVTYSGTFLKESSGARNFIAKSHIAGEDLGQLNYLNAPATEETQRVWAPRGPAVTACELSAVYSLHLEPGPKVAGRPTSALHLRPRDGLRLGYRLALDDVSGLILKSESFSEDGKLLERHEYASITVTPKDPADATERPTALMQHLDIVGLPYGYKASLARGFEEKALFVSDGIAAATVVFEPLPEDLSPGEGAVRHGATLTYSRGSVVSGTRILVTVIGEVPLAAARLIAEAVRVAPSR